MNLLLALGAVVVASVPVYFLFRRSSTPPVDEERQLDLPSLHSAVSEYPMNGRHDHQETAPSMFPRNPEWDTTR